MHLASRQLSPEPKEIGGKRPLVDDWKIPVTGLIKEVRICGKPRWDPLGWTENPFILEILSMEVWGSIWTETSTERGPSIRPGAGAGIAPSAGPHLHAALFIHYAGPSLNSEAGRS